MNAAFRASAPAVAGIARLGAPASWHLSCTSSTYLANATKRPFGQMTDPARRPGGKRT